MCVYSQTCKTTTSFKRPLAVNDHFKIYSLYILPLTNDHEMLSLTVNGPSFNGHLNAANQWEDMNQLMLVFIFYFSELFNLKILMKKFQQTQIPY